MSSQALHGAPHAFVIRKQTVMLALLFILPAFSDALYGMAASFGIDLPFPPGVLLRSAVLFLFLGLLLNHIGAVYAPYLIWPATIFLSALPSLFVGAARGGSLGFDVTALTKSLFLPIVAAGLAIMLHRSRQVKSDLLTAMEFMAYLYTLFIVVPEWLDVGVRTYGEYADGSSGFFTAGNDAGVTLGISLNIVAYRLMFGRFSVLRIAMLIAGCYACTLIGSRAALIFVAGAALTFTFGILFMRDPGRSRSAFRKIGGLVLVGGLVALLAVGLSRQLENRFQAQKFEEISLGALPRELLMISGIAHIQERPAIFNVTGEGTDLFQRGVAYSWPGRERRQVEVDWMDALGAYGIGFTVISHFFLISVIFSCAKAVVLQRDALLFFIGSGLFFLLAHSALAGHALYTPASASIGAGFIALAMTHRPQDRTRR